MVGHLARMNKRENAHRILAENLRKRNHLEDLGVKGRKTLKWIFKKIGLEDVD